VNLQPGRWTARGSLLAEGESRGRTLSCDVQVQRDDDGCTLTGAWQLPDEPAREFVLRVVANDVGTYTLGMRMAGDGLQGTAKLDSAPNLGLMWNDAGSVHVTFALFPLTRGYGLRGFARDGGHVYTWEMSFSLHQETVRGDNVVSLRRRR
jgi:hypothetical protein